MQYNGLGSILRSENNITNTLPSLKGFQRVITGGLLAIVGGLSDGPGGLRSR